MAGKSKKPPAMNLKGKMPMPGGRMMAGPPMKPPALKAKKRKGY